MSWAHGVPLKRGCKIIVWSPDGLESFDVEISRSVDVEIAPGLVVKVLPLDRVIASKRAANRKKDRAQLPVLRDALKILTSRG